MRNQKAREYRRRCLKEAFRNGTGAQEILRWQWLAARDAHLHEKSVTSLKQLCNAILRDEAKEKERANTISAALSAFADTAKPRGLSLN